MNIDPHNATFSDIYELPNEDLIDNRSEEQIKKFRELVENQEITAIGPEDHYEHYSKIF